MGEVGISPARSEQRQGLPWPTCMIWSSFLMDSLLGPATGAAPPSVIAAVSCADAAEPSRARPAAAMPSRRLLVLEGFVCGEDAGEAARGGCRDC